jgi:hypothetical protein
MSGAAGISAAKNRRSRQAPNQPPNINCSNVNGSCPTPNNRGQVSQNGNKSLSTMPDDSLLDKTTLQILGPMPPVQILKIHELRLNKIDERLNQVQSSESSNLQPIEEGNFSSEYYDKIDELESKVKMLEEVIMNLQLTVTNVQSFAMETNLSLTKLQKPTNTISSMPVVAPVPELNNMMITGTIADNENIPTFSNLSV